MARSRSSSDPNPINEYYDEKRVADIAQAENDRRKLVAARQQDYLKAVNAGVPKSVLPDFSAIKTMSDADWNGYAGRIKRFTPVAQARREVGINELPAFNPTAQVKLQVQSSTDPVSAVGKVSETPSVKPGDLSTRKSFSGFDSPIAGGAGVTAIDRASGKRVSVTPNAEQAMSLKTGGAWDEWTPGQRNSYLRGETGQNGARFKLPVGEHGVLTVAADGSRRVDSPYGFVAPATQTPSVKVTEAAPPISSQTGNLTSIGDQPKEPLNLKADLGDLAPSRAPVASKSSDVLSGIPPANFSTSRKPAPTFGATPVELGDLNAPRQLTGAERAGAAIRSTVADLSSAVREGAAPIHAPTQPDSQIYDVGGAVRGFFRGLTSPPAPTSQSTPVPTPVSQKKDEDRLALATFADENRFSGF